MDSWRTGRSCPVFHTASGGEAGRANGMCQALKCHVCGLSWQAPAELHNKPVTDALPHWAFICHHCILWSCVLLPAKTERSASKHARSLLFFFFLKQPCSSDKGTCVTRGASPRRRLHSSHPQLRGWDVNSLPPHCVPTS